MLAFERDQFAGHEEVITHDNPRADGNLNRKALVAFDNDS
jgi:hypothetical protein